MAAKVKPIFQIMLTNSFPLVWFFYYKEVWIWFTGLHDTDINALIL